MTASERTTMRPERSTPSESSQHRRAREVRPSRAPRQARITVINDYPDFIELMRAALTEEGHVVHGFNAHRSSVADVVRSRPELLFVDLSIREADGPWDETKLRAVEELRHVPIVVCSANLPALRELAETAGAVDALYVLEKPFTLDQLTAVVNRALLRH